MSIGFPAQYTEHFLYENDQTAVRLAAKKIINKFSWSIDEETESHICAKTPFNLLTWGENFQVDFSLEGYMKVTSKCKSIGWGVNRKNVESFVKAMEELI